SKPQLAQESYDSEEQSFEQSDIQEGTYPPRIGEIVLLSLLALGEGGPGQAEPVVLNRVLSAMMTAGLQKEVRALSLEAAVAAGL
ncbi:MAG: hypothetical protein HON02_05480, partial [Rhodospirillaceae bacterium]|nr:hypothetical protein [Rhodospirillaceae bacterium]